MPILLRYALFFVLVLSVIGGSHYLIGNRLTLLLPAMWSTAIWSTLVLLFANLLATMLLSRMGVESIPVQILVWTGYAWMGIFFLLLMATLGGDLFAFAMWAVDKIASTQWHALLVTKVRFAFFGLALLASGWAIFEARRPPRIHEVEIPVIGLPDAFEGYRIAHITDTHIGPTLKKPWVQDLVERVNAHHVDLVVHTGDLVDGRVSQLAPHVAPLAQCKGKDGAFFVTGNHESYSGPIQWADHARELGFDVLLNEHRVLHRGTDSLVIAGVTDLKEGAFVPERSSDPKGALKGAPEGVRILLAHQPSSALHAQDLRISLQLSGHTHGGQIWPFHYLVYLQQPMNSGYQKVGTVPVFTSNGAGYWGPPMRLFAPAEVPILVLRKA